MKPIHTLRDRMAMAIDHLDHRAELQTFRPGADHPAAVDLMGRYQDTAGALERRLLPFADSVGPHACAAALRRLRRILAEHRQHTTCKVGASFKLLEARP